MFRKKINRIGRYPLYSQRVEDACKKVKEKIQQEISDWCNSKERSPEMDEIVDHVISRTSETLFETIRKEFEEEFSKGNLEQPFFISNEYYLELKLKDIKNKLLKSIEGKNQQHESRDDRETFL